MPAAGEMTNSAQSGSDGSGVAVELATVADTVPVFCGSGVGFFFDSVFVTGGSGWV